MDTLLSKCNKLGLKMTDQRKIIVKVLSDSNDHPDVESVHKRASKIDKRIGIATVYRTIKLFEDNKLLEKHEFKGFSSRYETVRENHHHLIDIRTGNVKEFRKVLGNQLKIAAPTIALFSFRSLKELNKCIKVKNDIYLSGKICCLCNV